MNQEANKARNFFHYLDIILQTVLVLACTIGMIGIYSSADSDITILMGLFCLGAYQLLSSLIRLIASLVADSYQKYQGYYWLMVLFYFIGFGILRGSPDGMDWYFLPSLAIGWFKFIKDLKFFENKLERPNNESSQIRSVEDI